MNQRLVTAQ